MPATGSPDEGYVVQLREALRSRYEGRNQIIDNIIGWRDDNHPYFPPGDFKDLAPTPPYHPPDVKKLIRAGQSFIAKDMPRAYRVAADVKVEADKKAADLIARWFNKGYYVHARNDEDWWGQVGASLAEGPLGVWKTVPRKHAWATSDKGDKEKDSEYLDRVEKYHRGALPWVTTHVQSKAFLPAKFAPDGRLCEALEFTVRERPLLYETYEKELKQHASRMGRLVEDTASGWMAGTEECTEYWNDDTYQFFIGDDLVDEGTHKGGRPPYFYAQFSVTGSHDPAHESDCLCDPILNDVAMLQRYTVDKSVWAGMVDYPIFVLVPISEDSVLPAGKDWEIKWSRGKTTRPPDGFRWEAMQIPGTGADLNHMIQLHRNAIDQNSLAPILFGMAGDEMSGPVQQSTVDLAKAVFGPCLDSLARALNAHAAYLLRLIDLDIRAPVPMLDKMGGEYVSIGPKEIDGFYDVTHEAQQILQMQKVVDYAQAKDQFQSRFVTKRYVISKIPDVENPQEMLDAVVVEDVVGSNQVQAIIVAELLRELKADQEPPPPTVAELSGVQPPGQGTPPAQPGPMVGPNIPQGPGLGVSPVNPGMQPTLQPAPAGPPNGVR